MFVARAARRAIQCALRKEEVSPSSPCAPRTTVEALAAVKAVKHTRRTARPPDAGARKPQALPAFAPVQVSGGFYVGRALKHSFKSRRHLLLPLRRVHLGRARAARPEARAGAGRTAEV